MKNFYVMVPAVTISYIDHITRGREKLQKRQNTDGFISDDGFALGVVFLLRILGVQDEFAGLNWFDSVDRKYRRDKKESQKKMEKQKILSQNTKKSAFDEDENFAEELSIRRIDAMSAEY